MYMNIAVDRRNRLIEVLSDVLKELCDRNESHGKHLIFNSSFCSTRVPSITVKQYVRRLAKYTCCSEESLVLSLVYIDRLITKKGFILISHNVHRLILTSILVSAKFFDDKYYSNAFFGKVGGVSSKELNTLEKLFLHGIQFDLFVDTGVYKKYNECLMKRRAISSPNLLLKPRFCNKNNEGARTIHAFGSQLYNTAFSVPMIEKNRNKQRTKPIKIKARVKTRSPSAPLPEPVMTHGLIKRSNVLRRLQKTKSPNGSWCYGAALFKRQGTTKLLIRSA